MPLTLRMGGVLLASFLVTMMSMSRLDFIEGWRILYWFGGELYFCLVSSSALEVLKGQIL